MPENRQKDIKEAGLKSRTAMAWLRDNQLPAEPICYTLAYEYLFTDNPELKTAVDNADLKADNYRESLEKIYQENIIAKHYSQLSMHSDQSEEYVTKALSLLISSKEDMDSINDSVNRVKSELDKLKESGETDESLNEQAEKLSECTKSASKTLNDTAVELESLRDKYIEHKETASKDELTSILDNQGMFTTLKEALPYTDNYPMSVIRIDIDQFKLFNDANGKIMGDAVLKHLAKAFSSHLKGSDIVSRYGEDEFTIVLPKTPLNNGVSVADTLRKKVAAISLKKKGSLTPVKVTISAGVSEYNGKGSFDSTFDKAKKALLRSKDLGRNCVNCES